MGDFFNYSIPIDSEDDDCEPFEFITTDDSERNEKKSFKWEVIAKETLDTGYDNFNDIKDVIIEKKLLQYMKHGDYIVNMKDSCNRGYCQYECNRNTLECNTLFVYKKNGDFKLFLPEYNM